MRDIMKSQVSSVHDFWAMIMGVTYIGVRLICEDIRYMGRWITYR